MSRHVPDTAQAYCLELWLQYPFSLHITPKRLSKLGDYRYHSGKKTHVITLNATLNPYSFLITYLHEIAHLLAFQKHGFRIAPHGKQWKNSFQELMQPMLNEKVFPKEILLPLTKYMLNPKAASGSDHKLSLALQKYDQQDGSMPLAKVQLEQAFQFRNMTFVKEAVRRTRALCRDLKSGKRYLVSEIARVQLIREEIGGE
ncbi:SprT-like domain-containing protein [Catalinimonas niigatensis]|uniref:SprT-like domain-containing protein n=1 Tax=Catalinimonas niigatensis TaxID=1397264 RepID=UPI002664E833|nr:SprT-like domain-containing protein [Catalinimonas niigatensis]WPP49409.1 SprT-like domain-containing protein [Catalinimonas niigatensis]